MTSGPSAAACAGGARHAASAPIIPAAAARASMRSRLPSMIGSSHGCYDAKAIVTRLAVKHDLRSLRRRVVRIGVSRGCGLQYRPLSPSDRRDMFKLIGIVIAIIPVFVFFRTLFGQSPTMKKAVSEFQKQIDYLVWMILFLIAVGLLYSLVNVFHPFWG